jgi:hypothetical protein
MKKMIAVGFICAVAVMILAAGCCSQCKCKNGKCDVKTQETQTAAPVAK